MKKGLSSFILLIFISGFILITGISLNSCKSKLKLSEKESISTEDTMRLPCLLITHAMAQQWVDSGWTNPLNPNRIKILLFQFQAQNPFTIKDSLSLVAYPGKSQVALYSRFSVKIDDSTAQKAIVNPSIFANLVLRVDSLGIINPDGTLTNFSYVRMRPNTVIRPPFIVYEVEVVTDNVTVAKEPANPCPPCPYCPGGVCPSESFE